MAANFIGALISLTSKSEVRYQGRLASLSSEEATISLEQVKACGTEGRLAAQGRPQDEMPASDGTYEFIVFRAADVKDLRIDDPNPIKAQPDAPPAFVDPAIQSSSQRPPAPQQAPAANATTAPTSAPKATIAPAAAPVRMPAVTSAAPAIATTTNGLASSMANLSVSSAARDGSDAPASAASKPSTTGRTGLASGTTPSNLPAIPHAAAAAARQQQSVEGTNGKNAGRATSPRNQRNAPRGGAGASGRSVFDNRSPIAVPDADFDFAAANAKFEKDRAAAALSPKVDSVGLLTDGVGDGNERGGGGGSLDSIPPPPAEPKSFYDKSTSFFDSISSEVKERYERVPGAAGASARNASSGTGESRGGAYEGVGGGRGRGAARANRLAEERLNLSTFGEVGSAPRGGRGGRGGRGRGRGRGRGQGRGRGAPSPAHFA
ncbi:Uncharacterized mRNA-associated protein RAP55 [Ceraceosorus bombacis]|uniref:Uncharacterized mRNA-associated protein RAP55 n=1 Tax=Ceraceosorus bombacis TaxID=401625 RepID=A0A0P1BFW5_9BASI|nr:Uncharacterized mRNA-associated protein RAP55 [Ceraceosorus bombacis]